jgi:hypothetical protein
LQDPSKFTQIGIFGLKTNHLATLPYTPAGFYLTTHSSNLLEDSGRFGNNKKKTFLAENGESRNGHLVEVGSGHHVLLRPDVDPGVERVRRRAKVEDRRVHPVARALVESKQFLKQRPGVNVMITIILRILNICDEKRRFSQKPML